MAEPFLSEIRMFSFNFPPQGWALCNGQLLPINQNQALFALLGTTYGGNGQTNFALPNLRGRTPIHFGAGHTLGEAGGTTSVTLSVSQLPDHLHSARGDAAPATLREPQDVPGQYTSWATSTANPYATTPNTSMDTSLISNVGGSQPHTNQQPYLVINFCIALQGIFPSQS